MILTLALVGLIPLAYAGYRLGRGSSLDDKVVLSAGLVGVLSAAVLGLVPGLIVGGGSFLLGRGLSVEGGRGVALVLGGTAVLGFPFLLMGLFYLASLNA